MKSYKKYYILPEEPSIVYKALTKEITIQLWTAEEAVMNDEPGTEFEIFGGAICGMNLEFEENQKIVQEWYFGELEDPSIVTIKLFPHNKGTSVELNHTNIPDDAYSDIVSGWDRDYFGALIDFFTDEED
ncbi:MAG TPA: SRPBCC domain-containing protein [Chitinophagales bacterium]|nr:SRPBCC domain-containing protein [Chitinophagales bacterium]